MVTKTTPYRQKMGIPVINGIMVIKSDPKVSEAIMQEYKNAKTLSDEVIKSMAEYNTPDLKKLDSPCRRRQNQQE